MNIGREKPAMENFVCDLRAAVHTVARKPGFTIVVALVLAVGIATNTAIFSVVYGVLLQPLPYGQDARTVTIWQTAPKRSVDREETYASHADRTIHLFDGRIAEIDNI